VLVEPAFTPVSVVARLLLCPRARMESFDDDDEDDAASARDSPAVVCNDCDLSWRWAECVNGEDSEDASRLARASSRGPASVVRDETCVSRLTDECYTQTQSR
jgi:hypothetical protein